MCCRDWAIPLDRRTYQAYQLFPAERLGATVARAVTLTPGAPEALHASINPEPSGNCPFYAADRLCNIQREYGAALLSATCSSYPRALNRVGERLESSLMMSCPEAARNLLLDPEGTRVQGDLHSGAFRTDNFFTLAANAPGVLFKPYGDFALVRRFVLALLTDRARPLWHRLLLLGSFCQKLSALAVEEESLVPAIVADYQQIIGTTWGAAEMEANPAQPRLQLSVLLRLTAQIPQDASCGARFRQTYLDFVEGIAAKGARTDLDRFAEAAQQHAAYFSPRPWVLENYLVNYVYLHLFPFGRGGSVRHAPQTIFDEYLLLAVNFFWLNGLLTGIAGCHGVGFGDAQVIHAVQSFSREVEHTGNVPVAVLAFLRENRMDNLATVAAWLRP